MYNPFNVNRQEFSNYIYLALTKKDYFSVVIEELPEKLSEHNEELFIYFEVGETSKERGLIFSDVLVSLFIKSSVNGVKKMQYEDKFNELLTETYNNTTKFEGYEQFLLKKSLLPRMSSVEDGYTIISQPIVIIKHNN